jgi:transcriptional regulator
MREANSVERVVNGAGRAGHTGLKFDARMLPSYQSKRSRYPTARGRTPMYTPKPFAFPTDHEAVVHAIIADNPFAAMVLTGADWLEAVHIPFLRDPMRGPHGTLRAHVARANPVWKHFGNEAAMVIFWGPHAYVSPDWYVSEGLVPTWNYVAVHAYGVPQIVDDIDQVATLLADLSAASEQPLAPKPPWTMDRVPAAQRTALMHGIVAFEIPITQLEAKQKLSQNRMPEDVAGVASGLRATGGDYNTTVADLMVKAAR